MATIRNQAVKLGFFIFLVIAILVLSLLLIGGLRLWRQVDTYYVITSEAVSGIDPKSEVTLRGVAIGEVAAVELDRSDFGGVRIELEIDPDITLPAGSKAYFERLGLTGERAINISGGSLAEGRLPPGSVIPRGQTDLERLQAQANEATDELTGLINEVTATVNEVKVLVEAIDPKWIGGVLEAVDPERVAAIIENTEAATQTLASTSKQLSRTVNEGRAQIRAVGEDMDEVATKASTALEQADDAMQELSGMIEGVDNLVEANKTNLRITIGNLRLASTDLRRATKDAEALFKAVREQPSLLLRRERNKRRGR